MNIAVLGAPHTGRTVLAGALDAALGPRGHRVQLVATENISDPQGKFDLTLLCGLDLPLFEGPDPERQADGRQIADAELRAALAQHSVNFQVVYGLGPDRLANALRAVEGFEFARVSSGKTFSGACDGPPGPPLTTAARALDKWQSACEKCSDPACEHRIFTQLID